MEKTMKPHRCGLKYFLAGVIAIALFCSACAPAQSVALAVTPEPTPTATATPTPTPSPTPTATPTPTIEPIPDLTDEEAKKEIELLGMTFDPDTEIPINMPIIIFCSGLNEKGEENFFIEFAYLGEKQSSNTLIIATFWNQYEIFEFPKNSTNSIGDMLDGVLVAPRYESLHGVELEKVTVLCNLAYFCKQYGIRINKVNTQIGKEITASQGIGFEQDLTFTYEEFADYYVRAFAEENRMSAADYTDPIPYTPRTPAP